MNPYAIIGGLAGAILWTFAVFHFATGHESQKWKAREAKWQADSFALAADAQSKARAVESANANLSAQLEATRHDADVKTADADSRVRDALKRVRLAQTGARCNSVPGAETAGGDANPAAGSDGGLSDRVDDFTATCARNANILAAWVREAHGWAVSLPK